MKNYNFIIILLFLAACHTSQPHPDYVNISGKILNAKSDNFIVFGGTYSKNIQINKDGTFKDTLKLRARKYQLLFLKDKLLTRAFLENGADVKLNVDAKEFNETLQFELDFADFNNYLNQRDLIFESEVGFKKNWYRNSREVFNKKITDFQVAISQAQRSYPGISTKNLKSENAIISKFVQRYETNYEKENLLAKRLSEGNKSPAFEHYENYNGSKTSLSDFEGKYVYIDIWATWCAPCKKQIPYLEEIEKKYNNKNIAFVSISVDKEKDYDKWKAMVKDKNMSGVQLIAPRDFRSTFVKAYEIHSIPRFIFIDPKGNIVNYDAPRPMEKEKIQRLFSSINNLN